MNQRIMTVVFVAGVVLGTSGSVEPAVAQQAQEMGDWVYQANVRVSPDRSGDMAYLRPEDTSGVDRSADPALVLRCVDDRFEIVTMWGDPVGDGARPVTVRFDDGEPQASEWSVGTGGTTAFVPRGEEREAFAMRLLEARRVLVELRTESEVPLQMAFEPASGVHRVAQRLPCFPQPG